MGLVPSLADQDMRMRKATRDDGTLHYEYLVCNVDDLIICSQKPVHVIQELRDSGYELKGGLAPKTFLGVMISHHMFKEGTSTWY